MNGALPGSKYLVSFSNSAHTVVPGASESFCRHRKNACPFSASRPRCARYHSPNCFGSFALKNTPPRPVTRPTDHLREAYDKEQEGKWPRICVSADIFPLGRLIFE